MLYTLKTALFLAIFYLFFRWVFRKETFHRFNRIVLLVSILFSFLLPLVVWKYKVVVPSSQLPSMVLASAQPAAMVRDGFRIGMLLSVLYFSGVAFFFGRLLWGIVQIRRMIVRGTKTVLGDGIVWVVSDKAKMVFSWFGYIVIPANYSMEESRGVILAHEKAHIRLCHSCDLLLLDLVGCLQWFNPVIRFMRSDLQAIHEYEADEAVLHTGADTEKYQLLLIGRASGTKMAHGYLWNSFNNKYLKKRITMMMKEKSNRASKAKVLWALPLLVGGVLLFAQKEYVYASPDPVKDGKQTETVTMTVSRNESRTLDSVNIIVDGKTVTEEEFHAIPAGNIWSVTVKKNGSGKSGEIEVFTVNTSSEKAGKSGQKETQTIVITGSEGESSISFSQGEAGQDTHSGSLITNTNSVTVTTSGEQKLEIKVDGEELEDLKEDISEVEFWIDGKKAKKSDFEALSPDKIRSIKIEKSGEESGKIIIETKKPAGKRKK